jgi:hypothetical protein
METITSFLTGNFIWLFLLGAVAFWLMGRARSQKQREQTQRENERAREQATGLGIKVSEQAEGLRRMGGSTTGPQVGGDTRYEGTTGDIPWTMAVEVRMGDRGTGTRANEVWKQTTRWKTTSVSWPAGKFLMIMSTPGEMKVGDVKEGGLFNKMINWAANQFLDLYVGGYFGSEYKPLVNVEGATILRKEVMKDFYMITNEPALAEKFLDEATQTTMANWKKLPQGFKQEGRVDQFGLLFAPDGMLLACQAALTDPNEAKMFSDFGAALAMKARALA